MHKQISALVAASAQTNPSVILEVDAPLSGFHEVFSAGVFSQATGRPITIDDGFRIASMSKTMTAVLVMQLMEEGRLELDAPFTEYIDVGRMPVTEGHQASDITVRMLLNHTSGLWDFAMSKEWGRTIRANPVRYRHPRETLEWALTHGESVGPPGQRFFYSDTGYVLLGLLIEALTGQAWGDLCRNRIISPAGMRQTWLEGYESPRSTLSHPYVDGFDGLEIHGSVDWAAGGHVSTCADLRRFLHQLFHGRFYQYLATLDEMLRSEDAGDGRRYGAGVAIRETQGKAVWGHGGFWGSFMVYVPGERITITGTQNQVGADGAAFVDEVLQIVFANG